MRVTRRTLAKALVVVFVLTLVVMGLGASFAYQQSPERPERVVGPSGEVVATDEVIVVGTAVFQRNGLMNHGTVLGNGAYFGADYTADAQERLVANMREYVARKRYDAARSLAFYDRGLVQWLFWARLPGDLLVILGSVVFAYDVLQKRFVRREEPAHTGEGTVISRRVFAEDDESTDLDD